MNDFDHDAILARIASTPAPKIQGHTLEDLNHANALAEYFAQQRARAYH